MGNQILKDALERPSDVGAVEAAFAQIDTNHDGVLNSNELQSFCVRFRRMFPEEEQLDFADVSVLTLEGFQRMLQLRMAHSWRFLNKDVLRLVLMRLSPRDKWSCSHVCHSWRKEALSDFVWPSRTIDLTKMFPGMSFAKWFHDVGGQGLFETKPERWIEGFLSGKVHIGKMRGRQFQGFGAFVCLADFVQVLLFLL